MPIGHRYKKSITKISFHEQVPSLKWWKQLMIFGNTNVAPFRVLMRPKQSANISLCSIWLQFRSSSGSLRLKTGGRCFSISILFIKYHISSYIFSYRGWNISHVPNVWTLLRKFFLNFKTTSLILSPNSGQKKEKKFFLLICQPFSHFSLPIWQ